MRRREFLQGSAASIAGAVTGMNAQATVDTPLFSTKDAEWQRVYDRALQVLAANVLVLPPHPAGRFDGPVLIEGAEYPGMWLECGPLEGLVYRRWNRDAARNNHLTFAALQRPDGQFPFNNKKTEAGFGQIQMVVPVAATAWELAEATGDDELLTRMYAACSRWDEWLSRYRNTRGTGLCEGFCTYDTGHDNSPRWKGIPNRCPESDARKYPAGLGLPRLCPDLSATVYGGRVALARMARVLGKGDEAARWEESAEKIRRLILQKLYVEEDGAFYDLDANEERVRVRGDLISRVCGEHVIQDSRVFEHVWTRQLHNPAAFWGRYPLASIAMDDPAFVRPIPRNSWGGASQALTALRAPRWMEHYGKATELAQMMEAWCRALIEDGSFRQQMDPMTGVFTDGGSKGYSPAALVLVDYTWRLAGVVEQEEELWWNVRTGFPMAEEARFALKTRRGRQAELLYRNGFAELRLDARTLAMVKGTARVVTGEDGTLRYALGTSEGGREHAVPIEFIHASGHVETFRLSSNQRRAMRKLAARPGEVVIL